MLVNEHNIISETGNGALMRLFNSHAVFSKRPLENHHHTMIEISYIKSGSGTYTVGDKTYTISPSDIFIFASDEPHCITEINGSGDMFIMNVQFEPRFIWTPGNSMFDAKYLRVFLERDENFSNRLERGEKSTAEIGKLLLSMEHEFENREPEYDLIIKIRLLTVLVLLARTYDIPENFSDIHSNPNLSAMDQVMEYINSNISIPMSLDDLAQRANMSRSYFSTIFKQLNGMTPWEYILLKRVETAVQLLNHTNDSIIEIACACGFNSTANFNRAFKKITGRTPTSYRKD